MRFDIAGLIAIVGVALAAQPLNAADDDTNTKNSSESVGTDGNVLKPSSAWNADFGDEKCRLALAFGEGNDRHLLYFEQFHPSHRVGFTVAGPKLKGFKEKRPVFINFGTKQKPRKTNPYVGSLDGVGKAVIYSSLRPTLRKKRTQNTRNRSRPQLDLEAAKGIGSITLNQGHRTVTFATGDLHNPMQVLDHCAKNLLKVWGLDPDQQMAKSRSAKLVDNDAVKERIRGFYPKSALRKREQGVIRFRVMLDETGAVTDCRLKNATELKTLQSRACQVLSNATFEPALDADGSPMASYYANSISYRIN
ncbi:MAG: TonB family protein [Erythrobacter sp.]